MIDGRCASPRCHPGWGASPGGAWHRSALDGVRRGAILNNRLSTIHIRDPGEPRRNAKMRGFVATPLARSFAVWRHDRDRARMRAQRASNSFHGGPSAEPEDAQHVIDRAWGVAGLLGASSMERLPTEVASAGSIRRLTRLATPTGAPGRPRRPGWRQSE